MKHLLLGLILILGVTASVSEARNVRPGAAMASAHGRGIFYRNLYWSCAPGLRPQAFYSGGIYTTYAYLYPYGYVAQNIWIPGPGVWCLP